MKIVDFLRLLRGKITGLNAISARFDILQAQMDKVLAADYKNTQILLKIDELAERSEKNATSLNKNIKTCISDSLMYSRFSQQDSFGDSCNSAPNRLAFLLHSLELCNHFGPVWD